MSKLWKYVFQGQALSSLICLTQVSYYLKISLKYHVGPGHESSKAAMTATSLPPYEHIKLSLCRQQLWWFNVQVCNLLQHSFFLEFLAGYLMVVQSKLSAFDSYDIYLFYFRPNDSSCLCHSVLNTGSPYARVQSMYPSTLSLNSKLNVLPIQSCTLINPGQASVL